MRNVVFLVVGLALVACQKQETMVDKEKKAENVVTKTQDKLDAAMAQAGAAAAAADMVAGEAHVHRVACGCELGQACGNMIEVDGSFVPLTGDVGLQPMAFCGKKGLSAEVVGKKEGDAFVATAFKLVEPAPTE